MNALRASLVGYRVKGLLEDRPVGALYSVHARAAYCSLPTRSLLLIHCTDLGGIPFGIGARMEPGYLQKVGLERGMRVDISADRLFISSAGFGIDLSRATVWHPAGCSPGEFSPFRLRANVEAALREVARRGSSEGLGQMTLVLDELFAEKAQSAGGEAQKAETRNLLCRTCWEPLGQLIRGIREQNLPSVADSLAGLIGLGIGLTPSMDDVITGLICTLHRLSDRLPGGSAWVSAIGQQIRMLSSSKTTDVSRNHLLFASCGDRFEILDDLIDSLLFTEGEDLNDRIGQLVSCGATSGTELAVGVLLGMKIVLASRGEETRISSTAQRCASGRSGSGVSTGCWIEPA